MRSIVLAGAYVILWFLALQILLPVGIRAPHETGDAVTGGADPGAPHISGIRLKLVLATILAAVPWAILYALVLMKIIDI